MEQIEVNSKRWYDLTPLEGEEWRDIDFAPNYAVSNYGRILSKERYAKAGFLIVHHKNKILKLAKGRLGYLQIGLCIDGKKKPLRVHKLVACAFIPNPENFPQINHKNEDKTDNRVINLEWCTPKYNVNFGTGMERRKRTRLEKYGRNVVQYRLDGSVVHVYRGIRMINKLTGYNESAILKVCTGLQLTSYGYVWRYEEDPFDKYPITYDKSVHASCVGRAVVKYDLNGNLIKVYKGGLKETLLDFPNYYSIKTCLNGDTKTAHGFIWRYIGSPKPEPIENRKIVQYTMDCEYVAVYNSIMDAIRMLGHGSITSISGCLHKRNYSALGFIWRYENELPPTREEQYKVEQLDKDGNVMRRFISVKDALLSVGGKSNSSISLCLNGKKEYAYGYKWRYINHKS